MSDVAEPDCDLWYWVVTKGGHAKDDIWPPDSETNAEMAGEHWLAAAMAMGTAVRTSGSVAGELLHTWPDAVGFKVSHGITSANNGINQLATTMEGVGKAFQGYAGITRQVKQAINETVSSNTFLFSLITFANPWEKAWLRESFAKGLANQIAHLVAGAAAKISDPSAKPSDGPDIPHHGFLGGVWDGAVELVKGLGALAGYGEDGWNAFNAMHAWEGLGELTLAAAVYSEPGGASLDQALGGHLGDKLTDAGKRFVASNEWGTDPAHAGGKTLANVVGLLGTRGIGAGLRGAGTAAEASRLAAVSRAGTAAARVGDRLVKIPTVTDGVVNVAKKLTGAADTAKAVAKVDAPKVEVPHTHEPGTAPHPPERPPQADVPHTDTGKPPSPERPTRPDDPGPPPPSPPSERAPRPDPVPPVDTLGRNTAPSADRHYADAPVRSHPDRWSATPEPAHRSLQPLNATHSAAHHDTPAVQRAGHETTIGGTAPSHGASAVAHGGVATDVGSGLRHGTHDAQLDRVGTDVRPTHDRSPSTDVGTSGPGRGSSSGADLAAELRATRHGGAVGEDLFEPQAGEAGHVVVGPTAAHGTALGPRQAFADAIARGRSHAHPSDVRPDLTADPVRPVAPDRPEPSTRPPAQPQAPATPHPPHELPTSPTAAPPDHAARPVDPGTPVRVAPGWPEHVTPGRPVRTAPGWSDPPAPGAPVRPAPGFPAPPSTNPIRPDRPHDPPSPDTSREPGWRPNPPPERTPSEPHTPGVPLTPFGPAGPGPDIPERPVVEIPPLPEQVTDPGGPAKPGGLPLTPGGPAGPGPEIVTENPVELRQPEIPAEVSKPEPDLRFRPARPPAPDPRWPFPFEPRSADDPPVGFGVPQSESPATREGATPPEPARTEPASPEQPAAPTETLPPGAWSVLPPVARQAIADLSGKVKPRALENMLRGIAADVSPGGKDRSLGEIVGMMTVAQREEFGRRLAGNVTKVGRGGAPAPRPVTRDDLMRVGTGPGKGMVLEGDDARAILDKLASEHGVDVTFAERDLRKYLGNARKVLDGRGRVKLSELDGDSENVRALLAALDVALALAELHPRLLAEIGLPGLRIKGLQVPAGNGGDSTDIDILGELGDGTEIRIEVKDKTAFGVDSSSFAEVREQITRQRRLAGDTAKVVAMFTNDLAPAVADALVSHGADSVLRYHGFGVFTIAATGDPGGPPAPRPTPPPEIAGPPGAAEAGMESGNWRLDGLPLGPQSPSPQLPRRDGVHPRSWFRSTNTAKAPTERAAPKPTPIDIDPERALGKERQAADVYRQVRSTIQQAADDAGMRYVEPDRTRFWVARKEGRGFRFTVDVSPATGEHVAHYLADSARYDGTITVSPQAAKAVIREVLAEAIAGVSAELKRDPATKPVPDFLDPEADPHGEPTLSPADQGRLARVVALDREIRSSVNPRKRSRLKMEARELLDRLGLDPNLPDYDFRADALAGHEAREAVRRYVRPVRKAASGTISTRNRITTRLMTLALPSAASGTTIYAMGSPATGGLIIVVGLVSAISGGVADAKFAVIEDEVSAKASEQDTARRKFDEAFSRYLNFSWLLQRYSGPFLGAGPQLPFGPFPGGSKTGAESFPPLAETYKYKAITPSLTAGIGGGALLLGVAQPTAWGTIALGVTAAVLGPLLEWYTAWWRSEDAGRFAENTARWLTDIDQSEHRFPLSRQLEHLVERTETPEPVDYPVREPLTTRKRPLATMPHVVPEPADILAKVARRLTVAHQSTQKTELKVHLTVDVLQAVAYSGANAWINWKFENVEKDAALDRQRYDRLAVYVQDAVARQESDRALLLAVWKELQPLLAETDRPGLRQWLAGWVPFVKPPSPPTPMPEPPGVSVGPAGERPPGKSSLRKYIAVSSAVGIVGGVTAEVGAVVLDLGATSMWAVAAAAATAPVAGWAKWRQKQDGQVAADEKTAETAAEGFAKRLAEYVALNTYLADLLINAIRSTAAEAKRAQRWSALTLLDDLLGRLKQSFPEPAVVDGFTVTERARLRTDPEPFEKLGERLVLLDEIDKLTELVDQHTAHAGRTGKRQSMQRAIAKLEEAIDDYHELGHIAEPIPPSRGVDLTKHRPSAGERAVEEQKANASPAKPTRLHQRPAIHAGTVSGLAAGHFIKDHHPKLPQANPSHHLTSGKEDGFQDNCVAATIAHLLRVLFDTEATAEAVLPGDAPRLGNLERIVDHFGGSWVSHGTSYDSVIAAIERTPVRGEAGHLPRESMAVLAVEYVDANGKVAGHVSVVSHDEPGVAFVDPWNGWLTDLPEHPHEILLLSLADATPRASASQPGAGTGTVYGRAPMRAELPPEVPREIRDALTEVERAALAALSEVAGVPAALGVLGDVVTGLVLDGPGVLSVAELLSLLAGQGRQAEVARGLEGVVRRGPGTEVSGLAVTRRTSNAVAAWEIREELIRHPDLVSPLSSVPAVVPMADLERAQKLVTAAAPSNMNGKADTAESRKAHERILELLAELSVEADPAAVVAHVLSRLDDEQLARYGLSGLRNVKVRVPVHGEQGDLLGIVDIAGELPGGRPVRMAVVRMDDFSLHSEKNARARAERLRTLPPDDARRYLVIVGSSAQSLVRPSGVDGVLWLDPTRLEPDMARPFEVLAARTRPATRPADVAPEVWDALTGAEREALTGLCTVVGTPTAVRALADVTHGFARSERTKLTDVAKSLSSLARQGLRAEVVQGLAGVLHRGHGTSGPSADWRTSDAIAIWDAYEEVVRHPELPPPVTKVLKLVPSAEEVWHDAGLGGAVRERLLSRLRALSIEDDPAAVVAHLMSRQAQPGLRNVEVRVPVYGEQGDLLGVLDIAGELPDGRAAQVAVVRLDDFSPQGRQLAAAHAERMLALPSDGASRHVVIASRYGVSNHEWSEDERSWLWAFTGSLVERGVDGVLYQYTEPEDVPEPWIVLTDRRPALHEGADPKLATLLPDVLREVWDALTQAERVALRELCVVAGATARNVLWDVVTRIAWENADPGDAGLDGMLESLGDRRPAVFEQLTGILHRQPEPYGGLSSNELSRSRAVRAWTVHWELHHRPLRESLDYPEFVIERSRLSSLEPFVRSEDARRSKDRGHVHVGSAVERLETMSLGTDRLAVVAYELNRLKSRKRDQAGLPDLRITGVRVPAYDAEGALRGFTDLTAELPGSAPVHIAFSHVAELDGPTRERVLAHARRQRALVPDGARAYFMVTYDQGYESDKVKAFGAGLVDELRFDGALYGKHTTDGLLGVIRAKLS